MKLYQEDTLTELGAHLMNEPARAIPLYQIPDAFEAIENALLENGGDLTPELEAELDAIEGVLEWKAERICRLIRNNEASAKAYGEEIDRLQAHKRTHENTVDRLKRYLQSTMERLDRDKINAGVFKVALQKNSRPSIRWNGDVNDIPERYKRVTVELNGATAYEDFKADVTLPNGFEVQLGKHVRVR